MTIRLSDHFTYKKLLRFVLPSVVMMMFTSVYGVVDGLFVSNFVGKTPFAAINLVMPFIMVLGGVGFMVGTGGSALVGKTLGEGDRERADRYFTMMVWLTVLLGVLTSVVGIVLMPQISVWLRATPEMLPYCVQYGRTVLAFNMAFMLQNVFQSFFVTAEKPRLGLLATVAAGVTNMVLDALFIAVFDWGVVGAAVATGISQCVGGLLPLVYFYVAASAADAMLPGNPLKRIAAGIKKVVTWALTGALVLFTGYLTISGAAATSADALTLQVTRTVISTAVPVVGGIISQASGSVLSGAGLLKNSIGIFGMLAVLATCLTPFLRLAVQYLLYKITAFLAGTAGNGTLVELVDALGSAFGLMLGMVGSCALLLLISITSSVSVVIP